jgi:hypothetical protein
VTFVIKALSQVDDLPESADIARLPEQDIAALRGLDWRRSNSLESREYTKEAPRYVGARGCERNGGFALGGNHQHREIPKQGDSWAGRMGLTQKIAPARPKSRGWAVTPHIPME